MAARAGHGGGARCRMGLVDGRCARGRCVGRAGGDRRERAAHGPGRAVRRAMEARLRSRARRDQRQRRHSRPAARSRLPGQPQRPASGRRDRAEVRRRSAHRDRAGRFLQRDVDGRVADLPARAADPVRLHELASRLHEGRRLSVEHRAEPGRGAAAARTLRGEGTRLQADRGAVPEHRLGPHQQGHLREGGGRARRAGRRGRRLPADGEGFPFDARADR